MKQKPAKRGARAWAIAIPAGILLLLLLAAFLIGNGGASAFRDDVDAILAAPRSEELGELSFADDGSAVVRLYKNDLYVLARAAFCPVSGGRCASGSAISISASA